MNRLETNPSAVNVGSASATGNSTQVIGNVNIGIGNDDSYLPLLKGGSDYDWWKDRNEKRADNTCNWFLNCDSYQDWLKADTGPLLVSADPGCGKSVLARYLIDSRFEGRVPQHASICHFFFKDGGLQSRIDQALCALLHQLFCHQPHLEEKHFTSHAKRHGEGLARDVSLLWKILEEAVGDPSARPVILVLDALDECLQDPENIARLLGKITTHFSDGPGTLKVIMTSRPYDSTMLYIDELERQFPNIRIRGEDDCESIRQEIEQVITHRVQHMTQFTSEIREYIKERLLAIPHRTYLWCALVFDYLKHDRSIKRTRDGIRRSLEYLPGTVDEAYEKILMRSSNSDKTRKALLIVLAAKRPLTLREMQVALDGVPDYETPLTDSDMKWTAETFDLETDSSFKQRLRDLCGLFLAVYHGRVSFLHQTAREFLLPTISQPSIAVLARATSWAHSLSPAAGHGILARACLVYLDVVDTASCILTSGWDEVEATDLGFLCYSIRNWDHHGRNSHALDQEAIAAFMKTICDCPAPLRRWFHSKHVDELDGWIDNTTSDLMIACIFSLDHIVMMLLDTGQAHADYQDGQGRTALIYAARSGSYEAAALLSQTYNADINIVDDYSETAISWALFGDSDDHAKIIRLLLGFDHIEFSIDTDGENLLGQAAERGNAEVFEVVLAAWPLGVDVKNRHGRTPLSLAAEHLLIDTIEALLATNAVDVNSRDYNDQTPLHHATQSLVHDDEVCKALLGTPNVEADPRDSSGQTPLSVAAKEGCYGMVASLIEIPQVDIDSKDDAGRTPLSYAVRCTDTDIVELLILTQRVDINSTDNTNRTPLSHAAEYGCYETVKMLLVSGKADAEVEDTAGRTALWWVEHSTAMYARFNKNDRDRVWEILCEYMYRQQAFRRSHVLSIRA